MGIKLNFEEGSSEVSSMFCNRPSLAKLIEIKKPTASTLAGVEVNEVTNFPIIPSDMVR